MWFSSLAVSSFNGFTRQDPRGKSCPPHTGLGDGQAPAYLEYHTDTGAFAPGLPQAEVSKLLC